jgi:hypothetical protein
MALLRAMEEAVAEVEASLQAPKSLREGSMLVQDDDESSTSSSGSSAAGGAGIATEDDGEDGAVEYGDGYAAPRPVKVWWRRLTFLPVDTR